MMSTRGAKARCGSADPPTLAGFRYEGWWFDFPMRERQAQRHRETILT
jgi:hypothetical protein